MVVNRSTGKLQQIPPDRINRNPENPRLIFRQEEMESLLKSINSYGIQVPLTVYSSEDGFILIDGERRWRCALKLNLRTVPALVQDKPTELENLLLMYNIHALREQWDYFTIASKLIRVIELYTREHGREPTESQLSDETGLTRGQIRRCRLLLDLPEKYQKLLHKELELPKPRQKLSEDFFLEMERSLKTITTRFTEYQSSLDEIRDTLINKFGNGAIQAVTDFRQLSKIATAVDNVSITRDVAKKALDTVFDEYNGIGIREIYEKTVEFGYDERKATLRVQYLIEYIDRIIYSDQKGGLDSAFLKEVDELYMLLKELLGK